MFVSPPVTVELVSLAAIIILYIYKCIIMCNIIYIIAISYIIWYGENITYQKPKILQYNIVSKRNNDDVNKGNKKLYPIL